jgi:hypothetical protein
MKIIRKGKVKVTNLKALSKSVGCPNCGETKRSIEYGYDFNHKGISKSVKQKEYTTGFFKKRYWKVDQYYCLTCGCEWEGEPRERNKI